MFCFMVEQFICMENIVQCRALYMKRLGGERAITITSARRKAFYGWLYFKSYSPGIFLQIWQDE